MDYQLAVVKGRSSAQAIQLGDGVTTVGRHDECQLRIKSSLVSRKHCELFEKKGLLLLKDLGSSNGTFVNGERIKDQRVLEPGDEISIGQIKLKVLKAGAPAPEPPGPVVEGKKPSDTAVVVVAPESEAAEDEFEIEFDDIPMPGEAEDAPPTLKEPVTKVSVPLGPTVKKAPEPEPEVADQAVADFLLDIKLDDE